VSAESERTGRIPTLDGWRAIAIFGVLCTHIRWPLRQLAFLGYGGDLGVQLFFALSGFLITSRLLEEYDAKGAVSWPNFYIRRVFRILPPAFFYLSVLVLLGPVLQYIQVGAKGLAASAFFYRNYVPVASGWYTAHFWSLAVEEHFYLLWPAVLCVVGVARGWRAALVLAGVFILWRHADKHFDWVGHFRSNLQGNGHRTDYRISGLFLGCALAYLWRNQDARAVLTRLVRSWWSLPMIAATIALVRHPTRWSDDGLDLFMAILPVVTIADPRGIVSRALETSLLRWVGRLSYSLYLWQQLFLPLYDEPKSLIQQLPFNVVAAFLAAVFSYRLVERPLIAYGRRLVRAAGSPSRAMVEIPSALSPP
jgi:peptidoglycan/LPS O-acetylase OafA/YrhL